jgi:hypothetical protein
MPVVSGTIKGVEMVCVWLIIFKSKGEGGSGDVKGTEINYMIWRTMFNVMETLNKYDLNIGRRKCEVRVGN